MVAIISQTDKKLLFTHIKPKFHAVALEKNAIRVGYHQINREECDETLCFVWDIAALKRSDLRSYVSARHNKSEHTRLVT